MLRARIRVALALLATPFGAIAQDAPPIHFALQIPRAAAHRKPGDRFDLSLTAKIDSGWHLYSINQGPGGPLPTQIGFAAGQVVRLSGSIDEPPPHIELDPNFNIDTAFFEDEAVFHLPVAVVPGASPGKHRVAADIRYQVCDARVCLPPAVVTAAAEILIAGSPSAAPAAPPAPAAPAAPAPAIVQMPSPPTRHPWVNLVITGILLAFAFSLLGGYFYKVPFGTIIGFLGIAAAMKFLSNADVVWGWGLFTRETVLAVWIAIAILTVLYVLGYIRLSHDAPVESIGAARLILTVIFLAVVIALLPGLAGRPLGGLDSFLPPAPRSPGS